jgi:hypothetical protein
MEKQYIATIWRLGTQFTEEHSTLKDAFFSCANWLESGNGWPEKIEYDGKVVRETNFFSDDWKETTI